MTAPAAQHPLDALLAAAREYSRQESADFGGGSSARALAALRAAVAGVAAIPPDCAANLAARAAQAGRRLADTWDRHAAEIRHALALRSALLEALDLAAAALSDRGLPVTDRSEAGVETSSNRIAALRQLAELPTSAPRTCPDLGPHCSGHGTAVVQEDGKATALPPFAADIGRALADAIPVLEAAIEDAAIPLHHAAEVPQAVATFGGGTPVSGAIARVAELRDLAARWASLVAALRPLVEADQIGALEYRRLDAWIAPVESALHALRWLVGMEPEAPAFELPAPIPPEVLARMDELRAAGDPARWGMPAEALTPHGVHATSGDPRMYQVPRPRLRQEPNNYHLENQPGGPRLATARPAFPKEAGPRTRTRPPLLPDPALADTQPVSRVEPSDPDGER